MQQHIATFVENNPACHISQFCSGDDTEKLFNYLFRIRVVPKTTTATKCIIYNADLRIENSAQAYFLDNLRKLED